MSMSMSMSMSAVGHNQTVGNGSFGATYMTEPTLFPISTLAGLVVTRWQGIEMALTEADAASDIRWVDPNIPYLQLVDLDLVLANGQAFKIWSQLEGGTGFHGLYLEAMGALPAVLASDDPLSIFRSRLLPELPVGAIEIAELRQDGPNATVEVRLMVAGVGVRLVAGEVYEQHDGSLRIIEPDESILLQVNGTWPPKH
jgi:hypothetical protein